MCLKQKMEQKLEVFEKESIDLIFTRYYDASKMAFKVRRGVQTSKVPILMLTALHDEETQVRTFELLVDGFIQNHSPRRFA